MIKAYFDVVEVGKTKKGEPFRILQLVTIDNKTGEMFKVFEFAMKPIKLDMYDALIDLGILKHDNDDV